MGPESDLGFVSPHILVCDDAAAECAALATFLRFNGYTVDQVGDGAAAVKFLKEHEIDAILLDLQMPDPDGFHVLSYIQEHRRALPVLLLSGLGPDDIQHEMHRLPSHELPPLLIKPIEPDQLLQILELRLAGELPAPD
jgi:CheY-like chemotaxis protein